MHPNTPSVDEILHTDIVQEYLHNFCNCGHTRECHKARIDLKVQGGECWVTGKCKCKQFKLRADQPVITIGEIFLRLNGFPIDKLHYGDIKE